MKYIIRITDDNNRTMFYKGIKKNPYISFGHLADWSCNKLEAKVFSDKDIATREASGLNEIAIVVSTMVIEISDNGEEKCILTLGISEAKKKTMQLVNDFIEKRYGKTNCNDCDAEED